MKIISNRKAIHLAIQNLIFEKSTESPRIDALATNDSGVKSSFEEDDTPIQPSEMMSTQLAVERPPVEDPDYVPASAKELGNAASAISGEVPEAQVGFFYRKLHRLLDTAIDRESESGGLALAGEEISESFLNNIFSTILKSNSILEQVEDLNDDEDEESDFDDDIGTEDVLDAVSTSVGESDSDMIVTDLANKVKETHLQIIEDWTQAGTLSDGRADLEKRYPSIFDQDSTSFEIGIELLSSEILLDDIQSASKSLGVSPAAIIMSAAREFSKVYDSEKDRSSKMLRPFSSEQALFNQNAGLPKELDDLLPEYSYNDIISIYKKRIADENPDPQLEAGYRDMISIVTRRISDPKKRERTDFSAKKSNKIFQDIESDGVQDSEAEYEARLKALDDLAPFFGFKNASGLRQWRRKYADPKFVALVGSMGNKPSYVGYAERILDNMGALLDTFKSMSDNALSNMESTLESNPGDSDLSDMVSGMKKIQKQFEEMQEASLEDEEGLIPTELLLKTAAGYMLREAFAEAYFNKQFRDYASEIKKHMVSFLMTSGIDQKISNIFAKMFNGEVDLLPLDSEKKQAEKLRNGGVTPVVYKSAIAESENFAKEFYTGERQSNDEKAFQSFLNDDVKVQKLFKKSIEQAGEAIDFESKLSRKAMSQDQISQLDDEDIVSEIRNILSSAIEKLIK